MAANALARRQKRKWLTCVIREEQRYEIRTNTEFRIQFSAGVGIPKAPAVDAAKGVTVESAVQVGGVINKRPLKNVQADKQNGDIELQIESIEMLRKVHRLPFDLGTEINF